MRWSKLKQRIEERFAPEAQTRVELHVTRYHRAHDGEGEIWLTLDGAKIFGASHYSHLVDLSHAARIYRDFEISDELRARGLADHHELLHRIFDTLSQSIDDMLESPHPLIRGLAVIDSRFGKRRLGALDLNEGHELVVRLAGLRRPVPAENSIHS
jgi:hypothetical protein